MPSLLLPFHLVLLVFAGWVNRHQLDVIEYLRGRTAYSKRAWVGSTFVLPTPNAAGWPERRTRSGASC